MILSLLYGCMVESEKHPWSPQVYQNILNEVRLYFGSKAEDYFREMIRWGPTSVQQSHIRESEAKEVWNNLCDLAKVGD